MNLLIQKHGIIIVGKVKDLKNIFAPYPSQITLKDYIRLNLH
ncbi:hypothetical protein [Syntrophomonas erecta]